MPMHASFVRGDVISVIRTNAHGVAGKGPVPGDVVKVGGRKKNGWLRVKCARTGDLVTIRSGRHLCLKSEETRPASQIDLLIRENQVMSAEQRTKVAENRVKHLEKQYDDVCEREQQAAAELAMLRNKVAHLESQNTQRQALIDELHGRNEFLHARVFELEQQIPGRLGDWQEAAEADIEALEESKRAGKNTYGWPDEGDWGEEEDDWCCDMAGSVSNPAP